MATIQTSIQIHDGMTPAFKHMNNAMNIVINSFAALQSASGNAIDTASIEAARQQLAQAGAAFNNIQNNIQQASHQQQQFNQQIQNGTSAASGLLSKLGAIIGTYLSFQAGQSVVALSDEYTNSVARIDMMNDGLQTTAELQEMIFQAAQRSYGAYTRTADLVGKIGMNAGDAFQTSAEVVQFAELLNKQFGIAGTNAEGISSATLQLTQALGSGVLRGEELNAVFEAAPSIIHTIADYLEVNIGQIREMAKEGLLSAEVVKNAMISATDEINDKFNSMPLTWSQVFEYFKNEALWAFRPLLESINDIANSDRFKSFLESATNSLNMFASAVSFVFNLMVSTGRFIYDNWSLIAPVIGTATTAVVIYTGALLALRTASMLQAFWLGVKTLALGLYTATSWASVQATIAATGAAWGLNAALYSNPVLLVVMAIVILIGILYLAVAVINKFAGTSISATGIVAGVFSTFGAFIFNIIAFLWNLFASIAEFFVNVWNHKIYSVKRLFANLTNNVLDMGISISSGFDGVATNIANAFIWGANKAISAINWIIDALNQIPGVDLGKVGSIGNMDSFTGTLKNIKKGVNAWVGEAPSDYWQAPKMEMKSLGVAWDAGYSWGEGAADKLSGAIKMDNLLKNAGMGSDLNGALDEIGGKGADTAANTAKMANSMEGSEEDLKYLRDLAEQEVVNRFTTAEISIDMSGMSNSINSEMDLDGVVTYLEEKVYETMTIAAEGEHE